MSSPMFYNNIAPLDKKRDIDLKLTRQSDFAFAKNTNSIAVAGFEFFEASRSFPIFFIKNDENTYIPLAIISFRKSGHELGEKWEGAYVPAYMRRYPFILSADGVVAYDLDAPHFQGEDGERLFTEEGEPTEQLTGLVDYLKMVDRGFKMTEEFCAAAADKELFNLFEGKVEFGSNTINLGDVHVINEKKLHDALNEAEVFEWFNKGWLAWAHAHLHSIGSLNEVLKRTRTALDAEAAEAAQSKETAQSEEAAPSET